MTGSAAARSCRTKTSFVSTATLTTALRISEFLLSERGSDLTLSRSWASDHQNSSLLLHGWNASKLKQILYFYVIKMKSFGEKSSVKPELTCREAPLCCCGETSWTGWTPNAGKMKPGNLQTRTNLDYTEPPVSSSSCRSLCTSVTAGWSSQTLPHVQQRPAAPTVPPARKRALDSHKRKEISALAPYLLRVLDDIF